MKKQPDFMHLWRLCVKEMDKLNLSRHKSIFLNHEHKKEEICRRFNIISIEDINRFSSSVKKA